MCCIPCFPYSDVDFEEEPRAQKRGTEAYQYVWNGQNWVLQPYNGRKRRSVSVQPLSFCLILRIKLLLRASCPLPCARHSARRSALRPHPPAQSRIFEIRDRLRRRKVKIKRCLGLFLRQCASP